ncbi:MAG TPA: tRNA pseudouridine(55) synthase TruB [Candidatus Saccharimonadales bacterium]|nr:tRNA pseudouridine(55) synthase TruB [Candidatus Saccharimonadales bacterium]
MQNPSGLVFIDKPAGLSSFGVVARVRRALSQKAGKKVKVGHTGTLDPFATGLMIIVVGGYCKRASEFSKLDKTYTATLRLGQTSSTGDPEGELTDVNAQQPTMQEVQDALNKFRGVIEQTPPTFSAIKIHGQRAYKLARAGKQVEMPKRTVIIKRLELTDYTYPKVKILCEVSSGTYIRTLAEDIGAALRTGAYTTDLRRVTVGDVRVDQAQQLDDDYRVVIP